MKKKEEKKEVQKDIYGNPLRDHYEGPPGDITEKEAKQLLQEIYDGKPWEHHADRLIKAGIIDLDEDEELSNVEEKKRIKKELGIEDKDAPIKTDLFD